MPHGRRQISNCRNVVQLCDIRTFTRHQLPRGKVDRRLFYLLLISLERAGPVDASYSQVQIDLQSPSGSPVLQKVFDESDWASERKQTS
jgi:hypothetical protein